jgi:hypothetical protein
MSKNKPITQLQRATVSMTAQLWARESAKGHLDFIGDEPFRGLSKERAEKIKFALIYFAELGAEVTVNNLLRAGNNLKVE